MRLALVALALAACGNSDPCDGHPTCVTLAVTSTTVKSIDQLEVDILYGSVHSTVTTQDGTNTVTLPIDTAIVLDLTGPTSLGLVVGGKLASTLKGVAAAQVAIAPGDHLTVPIELAAPVGCPAGVTFCGGNTIVGDPSTLYECDSSSMPIAHGVCAYGCTVRGVNDVCHGGGGPCMPGDFYCGGDKLDGDPSTRYTCSATGGNAINPTPCANGCMVVPGHDDQCL